MVSIIIPCKNRLNHLVATFGMTRRVQGDVEIIIVDYKCPMGTANFFERAFHKEKRLNIVRADVDDDAWSLSHARNLGYKASTGDALLFLDADTCCKSNFVTAHSLNQNEFYTGEWLHCSGCCFVWRDDFKAVKGYNEVIRSWGSEDYDLYRRLETKGINRKYFDKKLYKNLPHSDKIRNEYHGRKNIHISNEENYQASIKEFKSCLVI